MLKSEASSLARELMNKHNLGHWVFEFDRAKRRAGACHHYRRKISLSEHFVLMNERSPIEDCILHEIAHALAGPGHGHDYYWKSICRKIGAKPERCYDSNQVNMPKGRWVAVCGGCTREFYKCRAVRTQRYCRKCGRIKGVLDFKLSNQE